MTWSRFPAICFVFICLLATNILAQPKKGKPGKRKPPAKRLPTAERANIKIAKVNPQWTEQMKASAAKIDVLVEANYQHFNVTPNPMTNDSQLVSRDY